MAMPRKAPQPVDVKAEVSKIEAELSILEARGLEKIKEDNKAKTLLLKTNPDLIVDGTKAAYLTRINNLADTKIIGGAPISNDAKDALIKKLTDIFNKISAEAKAPTTSPQPTPSVPLKITISDNVETMAPLTTATEIEPPTPRWNYQGSDQKHQSENEIARDKLLEKIGTFARTHVTWIQACERSKTKADKSDETDTLFKLLSAQDIIVRDTKAAPTARIQAAMQISYLLNQATYNTNFQAKKLLGGYEYKKATREEISKIMEKGGKLSITHVIGNFALHEKESLSQNLLDVVDLQIKIDPTYKPRLNG